MNLSVVAGPTAVEVLVGEAGPWPGWLPGPTYAEAISLLMGRAGSQGSWLQELGVPGFCDNCLVTFLSASRQQHGECPVWRETILVRKKMYVTQWCRQRPCQWTWPTGPLSQCPDQRPAHLPLTSYLTMNHTFLKTNCGREWCQWGLQGLSAGIPWILYLLNYCLASIPSLNGLQPVPGDRVSVWGRFWN